ncbi:hypothetical protein SLEP1_g21269 [Rubroshorea leprosula]|uniref:AB hydrolase-1 domain-containing protein n=1 Tax=Rubroshorea leprosula TaxID=152421 RepID=A0AAV5JCW0_9ROSI|nr:hypothetical protein SLEP1_g21269 [Rubroshorea leprosula]
MDSAKLWRFISIYLSTTLAILRYALHCFSTLNSLPSLLFKSMDTALSLYFRFCGLSPCTIDLDDQTTMHFWTSNHRRFDRPALIMVHGYGGASTWQFVHQVGPLSRKFNLYIPDLLFFGESYSCKSDRSDYFQARCVVRGLRGLGVERFAAYGISYGGFVAHRMAEMYPDAVEKLVIVNSGIGWSEEQRGEQLQKIGRHPAEIFVPKHPNDLRLLVNLSMHKPNWTGWAPDFLLREFINVMYNHCRKEKIELIEHLLQKQPDSNIPVITQETLLIWGDQDKVFPVEIAQDIHRHLEQKSRLEIIKDTGHGANMESPDAVNSLIISFVSGSPNS